METLIRNLVLVISIYILSSFSETNLWKIHVMIPFCLQFKTAHNFPEPWISLLFLQFAWVYDVADLRAICA